MQRSQRIGLIAAAVVVAVVAFIVLQGGDDDSSNDKTFPTIEIKGGKPKGGVEELEVDKGEQIMFRVKSDEEHEIHLHGYDVEKEVAAGGSVTYDLKADIDGIFEAEIEDLKEPILELRVNP